MFGNYGIVGLIALLCAIWVIYEVWAVSKRKSTVEKIIWTVAAVFFSIITAIVYFIIGRK